MLSRSESRLCFSCGSNVRRGSTYLEVQVALILFALGVSGLAPLAVINARQTQKLRERVPADATQYLTPQSNDWSAKLGRPAQATSSAPSAISTAVTLVDDRDSGFARTVAGNWSRVTLASAYRGRYYRSIQTNNGVTATWTFNNLEPFYYEVFVTWPAASTLASNALFQVFDNASLMGAVSVNQQAAPNSGVYAGVNWKSLGKFPIASGTLKVRLSDTANKLVAADAVRIRAISRSVSVLSVQMQENPEQITVQAQATP